MSEREYEYRWSLDEIRKLDNRLARLETNSDRIAEDIKEIKEELAIKNHVVVDNSNNPDWKAIGVIAVSIIGALGTLYITIRSAL